MIVSVSYISLLKPQIGSFESCLSWSKDIKRLSCQERLRRLSHEWSRQSSQEHIKPDCTLDYHLTTLALWNDHETIVLMLYISLLKPQNGSFESCLSWSKDIQRLGNYHSEMIMRRSSHCSIIAYSNPRLDHLKVVCYEVKTHRG